MKHAKRIVICMVVLLAACGAQNASTTGVVLVSEQRLQQLLPATVFIDGENVPTQQRNAALVQLPNGKILLASLIDTAGYSSAYQEKYAGVLLSQSRFTLGNKNLDAGAYAIGQKKNGICLQPWWRETGRASHGEAGELAPGEAAASDLGC